MELFKLLGTIAIDSSGADKALEGTTKNAETSAGKIVNAFKKVATAVATYLAVDKIKDFGLACVNAAADTQAMNSQFEQVFGSLEDKASKSLTAIAKSAGITETRMKGSFTKIAAFAKTTGMNTSDALELSERAMIAVADSAAFYDRSLEETTESLQSFLKGNYENDAALGLSCTETTRNAAAMKLFGDEFKNLSEEQKQLTLLKMVEDANKTSGALGQAARESKTWTNQVGNLKQAWIDFQAKVGEKVLPKVVDAVMWLADCITELGNYVDPVFEKIQEVAGDVAEFWYEVLEPAFIAVWDAIVLVGEALAPVVQSFTDLIPGVDSAKTGMDYFRDACWAVEDALQFIAKALTAMSDWIKENQPLIENVILILGSWAVAQKLVNSAIAIYNVVAGTAVGISGALAAAIAFITSPATIATAGIAALIMAGIDLYRNWDLIKQKCAELWQFTVYAFGLMKDGIATIWQQMLPTVREPINTIIGYINGMVSGVTTGINSVINALNRLDIDVPAWVTDLTGVTDFGFNIKTLTAPQIPYLEKGGILEKGQVGLLEGKGAEAVVPLDRNSAWISRVADDMRSHGIGDSEIMDKVYEKLNELHALLAFYIPTLSRMQVCLDTGALIGELAPGMDEALGELAQMDDRGV